MSQPSNKSAAQLEYENFMVREKEREKKMRELHGQGLTDEDHELAYSRAILLGGSGGEKRIRAKYAQVAESLRDMTKS